MEDSEYVPVLEEKDLEEGKMKLVKAQGTPVLLIKQAWPNLRNRQPLSPFRLRVLQWNP